MELETQGNEILSSNSAICFLSDHELAALYLTESRKRARPRWRASLRGDVMDYYCVSDSGMRGNRCNYAFMSGIVTPHFPLFFLQGK